MDYVVGDWVVCENDRPLVGLPQPPIRHGHKYSVRELNIDRTDTAVVKLHGVRYVLDGGNDSAMNASRFRKLDPATDLPMDLTTSKPKVWAKTTWQIGPLHGDIPWEAE